MSTAWTVLGADNAGLRSIRVLNTGKTVPPGTYTAVAIYNNGTSPSFFKVTASAVQASHVFAVYNTAGAAPNMSNMICSTESASVTSYGVVNIGSSPVMEALTVSASGTGLVYGVHNYDTSSPTMTQVVVTATGLTGATDVNAVRNEYNCNPAVSSLTASAIGGTDACGIYNIDDSVPTMSVFDILVKDGTDTNYGFVNTNDGNPQHISISRGDITVNGAAGEGAVGVYNGYQCTTNLKFTTIDVTGGTDFNYGFYIHGPVQNVYLTHCDIIVECSESSSSNHGVYTNWGNPLYLDQVNISVSGTAGSHYGVRAHNGEINVSNSCVYSVGNAAHATAVGSGNDNTIRFSNCRITGSYKLFDGHIDQTTTGNNRVYAGSCMLTGGQSGASAFSDCYDCYDILMDPSTLCSTNN